MDSFWGKLLALEVLLTVKMGFVRVIERSGGSAFSSSDTQTGVSLVTENNWCSICFKWKPLVTNWTLQKMKITLANKKKSFNNKKLELSALLLQPSILPSTSTHTDHALRTSRVLVVLDVLTSLFQLQAKSQNCSLVSKLYLIEHASLGLCYPFKQPGKSNYP